MASTFRRYARDCVRPMRAIATNDIPRNSHGRPVFILLGFRGSALSAAVIVVVGSSIWPRHTGASTVKARDADSSSRRSANSSSPRTKPVRFVKMFSRSRKRSNTASRISLIDDSSSNARYLLRACRSTGPTALVTIFCPPTKFVIIITCPGTRTGSSSGAIRCTCLRMFCATIVALFANSSGKGGR